MSLAAVSGDIADEAAEVVSPWVVLVSGKPGALCWSSGEGPDRVRRLGLLDGVADAACLTHRELCTPLLHLARV